MSNVWVCVPSKRPAAEVTAWRDAWRAQGYKVALWRDNGDDGNELIHAEICRHAPYPGYALAVNHLVALALSFDKECDWIVTGGDDVLPDPNHSAEEIANQCADHFAIVGGTGKARTFGVMQPTGDRWGDATGPYIERVCGSPWMGREFCKRVNRGNGPLWPGYFHMGEDEELQAVAIKYGVLWQRPDLTHYHQHWGRPKPGEVLGQRDRMPKFLEHANSRPEWDRYKALFAERQAAGFPGSELL